MTGTSVKIHTSSAELRKTTVKENAKCLIICSLLAVATFQYGFDTTIINGFQAMQGFLRVFGEPSAVPGVFAIGTVFQQLITSLLQAGLICGSLIIGPFSTYFGRRATTFLASVIACISVTIQITVTSRSPIYVARLLMGIANGLYVNVIVLYISEVTPAHLRGATVSVYQVFTNLGTFTGAIVSNAFSTGTSKASYRVQLAILYAIPIWLAIYVIFIPESPRWLASSERYTEAERCLRRIRGGAYSEKEITEELFAIKESIRIERENSEFTDWRDIFKGTNLRRTLLCMASSSFHPASGINFVGHIHSFFQIAGQSKPFIDNMIVQACGFATAIASVPIIRTFGRRPILLTGFTLTTLSMFLVALLFTLAPHSSSAGKGMVAMVCLFNGAYGHIAWVIAGEIPSNKLRSYTFGLAMTVNFFFAWLTVFTLPYFINASELNWGPKIGWIWFPSNLVTLIFIYLALPETKGRTLEEIDELFMQHVPLRKFKGA
ncbi:hypothetical protein M422DRAFT_184475 [Sphaerobolus stellatus SS14]|uniref:Major facilitator superfamily (MFS) profile domain-containing protein n=1 Tax=Sphaerobolus stellatus (strain SS14) TaxID=990650 RepID=A0A0C9TQN0_SPHS4|nr:hypothetical protein M422DRAFT_184475 [Sphaerobolus stellatus SS14]